MQSLNKKEWKLLELQITQTRHPLCISDRKMSKSNPPQKWEKYMKCAQNNRCTSLICEQSICKIWIKRNENFWSYRLHKLGTPYAFRTEKCLSPIPPQQWEKYMKCVQNNRCTSLICEQSICEVYIKTKHPNQFRVEKMSKSTHPPPPQKWDKIHEMCTK